MSNCDCVLEKWIGLFYIWQMLRLFWSITKSKTDSKEFLIVSILLEVLKEKY